MIFNPALEFLLSCLFQFIIRKGNHYIFLITRICSYLVCTTLLVCHSDTPCSKSSQNDSSSIITFIKCLFLPVALPALLMKFSFLYSKSVLLTSLYLMVFPVIVSSIFLQRVLFKGSVNIFCFGFLNLHSHQYLQKLTLSAYCRMFTKSSGDRSSILG